MSQVTFDGLEKGPIIDGDQPQPTLAPNMPSQPSREERSFGDSSRPFFSIYSKAAEEEDKKMVEAWQKDADGILIFTGLFSAAVAALLTVTFQDLRPNSQDTSAFYLGNIYGVLADPNVTRAPITSPAEPPPFSPPRYTVWVNSLWALSFVMSLSCALWATSLHRWARRYIRLTQPTRCSPEKRAHMRAFYSNGVDKMHVLWAVEGLPTLLHISLFLFISGLVIYLFNVNRGVFTSVVSWVIVFSTAYGWITLLPLILHDSPYSTPLSEVAWSAYASIQYQIFEVLSFVTGSCGTYQIWMRCRVLRDHYRSWMLGGTRKKAEETASKQSSEINVRILLWTISTLGDDKSLETFFETIPGLFSSKLVKDLERDFSWTDLKTFWAALDGFMGRTLSSNSVPEMVKSRRVIICRDIMSMIPCSNIYMHDNLRSHFDQAPVSIERLQAMARWFKHPADDVSYTARIGVAKNLARMQDRDGRWIALASDVYGLAARDIQHYVDLGGDNVLLAALIDVSRRAIHSDELELVKALTHFDIRLTLPHLQHDFCALWNDFVKEAMEQGSFSIPAQILRGIRRLYVVLHQGTDASPTMFSASTDPSDPILLQPWSYPLCNLSSHRRDFHPFPSFSQPPHSQPFPFPVPRLILPHPSDFSSMPSPNFPYIPSPDVSSLPDPTTSSEIRDNSQALTGTSAAFSVTFPRSTDALPQGVVTAAPQDIPQATTLSHPLEGTTQQDIVVPCAEPNIGEVLSTASTSNPLLPSPPPPSHVPPLSNTEIFSLLSGTTLSHPSLPLHRARGLVNTGSTDFANTVLQLLVHSPPFWNLFRELGNLKEQRGERRLETGGGATPVVDATVRFLEEFRCEESPPTQQPSQQAARGKPMEDKDENKVMGSFEPIYLYDAMKKKGQLKDLLDGRQQDAEEFFHLYLDALDEELLALLASGVDEREVSLSGHFDAGSRGFTAEAVESPLMRIFGGKFRSVVRAPDTPDAVVIEDWRSLHLDIQHDSVHAIEDALTRISHLQPVQLGPSGFREASQQVLIETLPPVLVLHLKRFLYDVATNGVVKTSKFVQFAPELDIPLEIMAPVAGKSAEPVHYKLNGVLYHHGESASGGHYTVDVLHPNEDNDSGEAWLRIDDEAVRAVRHEDLFGDHDRCAYVLFYCRTAPTQT